jgi:energy-coupling factor transporter ATP-binding protein EcfA2
MAQGSPELKLDASRPATPVYVTSLRLKNVRCFGPDEQTLQLADASGRPCQWTVIVGDNGTGKTTLLECLLGFTPSELARFFPPFVSFASWRGSRGSRPFGASQSDAHFEIRVGIAMGEKLRDWNQTIEVGLLRLNYVGDGAWRWMPEGNVPRPLLLWAYGASRRMRVGTSPNGGTESEGNGRLDDGLELKNAEEWLLELDYARLKTQEEPLRRRFEQVRQLLINVLPDVEDIRITTPSEAAPKPRVEFHTPDGWLPFDYIGFGYRTLVAWMVDFASRMVERYPDSQDPLSEAAIVLVDEIDLHLHPKWQRSLMAYLSERFPNTQFIVTAHSPIFVQAAADANIVVLRRSEEKGHVVIDNSPQAIRGWRLDQILTSDLFGLPSARGPEMEKLLEQRTKLLSQPELSKADKKKLEELERKIGFLPVGETADEAKTSELLAKALENVQRISGEQGVETD